MLIYSQIKKLLAFRSEKFFKNISKSSWQHANNMVRLRQVKRATPQGVKARQTHEVDSSNDLIKKSAKSSTLHTLT